MQPLTIAIIVYICVMLPVMLGLSVYLISIDGFVSTAVNFVNLVILAVLTGKQHYGPGTRVLSILLTLFNVAILGWFLYGTVLVGISCGASGCYGYLAPLIVNCIWQGFHFGFSIIVAVMVSRRSNGQGGSDGGSAGKVTKQTKQQNNKNKKRKQQTCVFCLFVGYLSPEQRHLSTEGIDQHTLILAK
jgi:hypothetical protein